MIKKTIIRVAVLLIVFISSFALFSQIMNSDNIDKTMKLSACSLPTITAVCGERNINFMSGYTENMDGQYMRDTITPLDNDKKLNINIQTFGETVKSVAYEVRSLDTKRLIEDTKVDNFTETNENTTVRLNIQDLLADNTEYLLIVKLSTSKYDNINYYTRIVKSSDYYIDEKLSFVLTFHDKTLAKSEDIVSNLESNSSGDNSNYNFVNINSSFSQVTFGDMDVKKVGDTQIQLQEVNASTAVIVLKYQTQIINASGETETFNMREFYRVRYTKDRMYLLEFERTMDEVFDENNNVYYAKALSLGISDSDVEYMSNGDGTIVSFVQQGNLYSYNSNTNSISKIYGFSGGNDIRYNNLEHDIKIVNVDESGSTDFIVTGYMVRGEHEGKTGVAVFHYDSVINGVDEKLFLKSTKSYQVLKSDIGDLAYMSAKGVLYISFADNVYDISLDSGYSEVLVDSEQNGNFVVSKDNVYMAWQQEKQDVEAQTLNLINFDSGEITEIKAPENERIKPIGFMGDDLVYGLSRTSDIVAGNFAAFPMYKIVIVDAKLNVVKEYEPSGFFVTQGTISENMIDLTRVTFDGSSYQSARSDQIVHSVKEENVKVLLASITTETKKKEFQLQFNKQLNEKMPKCLYPKIIVYNEKEDMDIIDIRNKPVCYVYAKGKLDSIYTNPSEAFFVANGIAGVVVTENQACVYDRVKKHDKFQLQNFATVPIAENMDSLTASVKAVCEYYGISVDVVSEVAAGKSALDVLKENLGAENTLNLNGQSVDNVLYMVSAGYPVIVKTDSENYGVIVGYDALNTIVMNPVTGKTGYIGMEDSRTMFSQAGNVFIGCVQ